MSWKPSRQNNRFILRLSPREECSPPPPLGTSCWPEGPTGHGPPPTGKMARPTSEQDNG